MANGALDPGDFVLRSGPRSGLKREFAFALKSQSQFPDSVGRTRSGKKRKETPLSPRRHPPAAGGRVAGVECPILVDDCEADAGPVDATPKASVAVRLVATGAEADPSSDVLVSEKGRVAMQEGAVNSLLEVGSGGAMEVDCQTGHSLSAGIERTHAAEFDVAVATDPLVEEASGVKSDQVVMENVSSREEKVASGLEISSLGNAPVAAKLEMKAKGVVESSSDNKCEKTTMAVNNSAVYAELECINQSIDVALKKKRINGTTAEKALSTSPVPLRRFTRSMLRRQLKVTETATLVQTNVAEKGVLVGDGANVERGSEIDNVRQEEEKTVALEGLISLPEICVGGKRQGREMVDILYAMEADRRAESVGKLSGESVEMIEELEEAKTDQSVVTEENGAVQEAVQSVVLEAALPDSIMPEFVSSGSDRIEMVSQSLDIADEMSVQASQGVGENTDTIVVAQVLPEVPVAVENNIASLKIQSVDEYPVATVKTECTNDISMEVPSPVSSVRLRRFTRSTLKEKLKMIEESSPECADVLTNKEVVENGDSKVKKETVDVMAEVDVSQLSKASQLSWSALMKKLELKMSKKIAIDKCPSNARELLSTGLLEGLPVRYLFNSERKQGLCGTIQDQGILCTCNFCKGTKVITPCQFERHAGSLKKRSVDNIFLDNGRTIRDVIKACSGTPIDMLEATIRNAISCSPVEQTMLLNCKESLISSESGPSVSVTSARLESKQYEAIPARVFCNRTSLSPRPASLMKTLDGTLKQISQKKISHGRVTKKDLGLHKLVFSEDALPDGTEVAYYSRGQRLLEGYKQGNGIFCRCCNTEVSPSQFEAHAGWASRRKPYLNIYTSNGVSLHELSLSLSKGRKHSSTDNDDLCSICFDGGDLLLCDICPRAFHKDCVGLASVPRGKWFCEYCQSMIQREKHVEHNANAMAAGRVLGVDPIEEITKRCIRIVEIKAPETDVSCCVLCRQHHFSKKFGPRTVILCDQCEKEYHVGCLKDHNMGDLKELPKGNWFCCGDCNQIHKSLQKIILDGSEKLSKSLYSFIKTKGDAGIDTDCDVRWRLLSGKDASSENRVVLSKAVGIFHERFDPIIDALTGRDLIPSMVYGRSMRDQDFGGMYCAVLTVNSTVVSAGILRIFGQGVAELPLVATSTENQGQGYFQTLFSCIERLLGSLNVKNLLLPAADEAESIWTKKFGFKKISQDELREYAKGSHVMSFQGTSMLHKLVLKCEVMDS